MAREIASISRSASSSRDPGPGKGASMMVRPERFGRRCQISSVTKGMNGCSRRSAPSSDCSSADCAPARSDGVLSPYSAGLESSMAQSHSSPQTKR